MGSKIWTFELSSTKTRDFFFFENDNYYITYLSYATGEGESKELLCQGLTSTKTLSDLTKQKGAKGKGVRTCGLESENFVRRQCLPHNWNIRPPLDYVFLKWSLLFCQHIEVVDINYHIEKAAFSDGGLFSKVDKDANFLSTILSWLSNNSSLRKFYSNSAKEDLHLLHLNSK